ncbi:MAG: TIGR03013 family PEP-CTERM/XrtA system glycosyltransferase [Pseudomonadales bacterium]
MPHIRILRHYLHTSLVILAFSEALICIGAAYLGYYTRFQSFPEPLVFLDSALTLSAVFVAGMIAMGVYESRIREGMTGMSLRTAVAVFLLGTSGLAVLSYIFPSLQIGRGVLLFAAIEAFILITLFRWLVFSVLDEDSFKKTVVVLGIGERATKIAARMRRRVDQRAFKLLGFMDPSNSEIDDRVSAFGGRIIRTDQKLADFCETNRVDEIVVAMDERRRNRTAGGGLPLEELMDCRVAGVQICDVQQFIEREAGRIDVDLLRPSWVVFSDGFIMNSWRAFTKRTFDLLASLFLLLFTWPFMLLAAIAIRLESGRGAPILYRQTRTGLDGAPFDVFKFRSMRTDAEAAGKAQWAQQNDPRVTRVGSVIRKTRIDELPQLFNVFRGEMSFVGPRPERPMFVEDLTRSIPFYEHRHRVKPGITGWAQLCYPYGASVEDAKEKLQYDLYYLKNNSLLLDLIILLQTVEVVLIGDGAR